MNRSQHDRYQVLTLIRAAALGLLAGLLLSAAASAEPVGRFEFEPSEPTPPKTEPGYALPVIAEPSAVQIMRKEMRDQALKIKSQAATIERLEAELVALHAAPVKMIEAEKPAEKPNTEKRGPGGESVVGPPRDARPLVRVASLEWEHPGQSNTCPPCIALFKAAQSPLFPYRLEWIPPGPKPEGFPTLLWVDSTGQPRKQIGWSGLAAFQKYRADTLPAVRGATLTAGSPLPIDQIKQYLGSGGTLTIVPNSPVKAILENGASVTYSRFSGRYSVTADKAALVLDQPQPHIDTTVLKLHFGAALQSVEFIPPATATAVTSAGRFRINLEPEK